MTPSATSTPVPVIARVDGWALHLPDLQTAVVAIMDKVRNGAGFTVFTLNLDHLVKLRSHADFQDAYRKADLVTADGAPVAWLARRQSPGIERATGADLFLPLVHAAARDQVPLYLFGSSIAVLSKTVDALREATGGRVVIADFSSPSGNFDPMGAEADAAIERIKASGAGLCFVLLGAPKQEVFSARAVTHGCRAGFVCIGASADFIAGAQVRAPVALQKAGLEWAWRLATNPRRLAKRYADCALLLFDVTVIAPIRRGLSGREI